MIKLNRLTKCVIICCFMSVVALSLCNATTGYTKTLASNEVEIARLDITSGLSAILGSADQLSGKHPWQILSQSETLILPDALESIPKNLISTAGIAATPTPTLPTSFDVSGLTVTMSTTPGNTSWSGSGTVSIGALRFTFEGNTGPSGIGRFYKSNVPSSWNYSGTWTRPPSTTLTEIRNPEEGYPYIYPVSLIWYPSTNTYTIAQIYFQTIVTETSPGGTFTRSNANYWSTYGTALFNGTAINFSPADGSGSSSGAPGFGHTISSPGFSGVIAVPTPTPTPSPTLTPTPTRTPTPTPTPVPIVTNVQREYSGFFLTGFDKLNNFDVRVNWNGTPGRVRFQINNGAPFEVVGTSAGAIKAFNLKNDFTASYAPSTIKITPISSGGIPGETRNELIYVFPYPTWLTVALAEDEDDDETLFFTTQPGEIRANFKVKFPSPEFKASGRFEEYIPFIGGEFGIAKAQGIFMGYASSAGSGSLTLGGETKFRAFGQELSGDVNGTGNFLLTQGGLSITDASLNLGLAGTVSREESLITAIPALAPFRRFPAVRAFTDTVRLRGEASPSVAFATTWKQDAITRDLVFNEATGTFGVSLKGVVTSKISDRFKFQGWLAGGGNFVIGTPSPYLRSASVNFEAGAQLNIDGFFGGQAFKAKINYGCTITTATNAATCASSNPSNLLEVGKYFNPKLKLIQHDYSRFGQHESIRQTPIESDRPIAASPEPATPSTVDNTVVSNVFSNAEPTLLPVGGSGKLLLWVRQNPSLPVLQSTDLAWSYHNGTSWTTPAVITADTRADFSPVAGIDANGRIVAAWLKIRTPAFTTPVSTLDDLPFYYKQVEVVSAVFNPATLSWSNEASLTNDMALDTSLRLANDTNGSLLLTWQSNPTGEFTADKMNPGSLKYSFWNGSSWNDPLVIAGNLSGASEHAVALKSNNALVVLPHDPDLNVSNDSKLLAYSWNGNSWSQGNVFAAGNVDNQSPNVVFDSGGKGQIIWRRGGSLVQANLIEPTPQTVRLGSDSAAFYNVRLLNSNRDNLTLIWHEVIENGPANIFAKFYDPSSNTWGIDRRLNQDQWQSKDTSGYYDATGNLQLVYAATEILRVTQTVTINGQNFPISNIPENGQSELRLLTVNQPNPTPTPSPTTTPTPTSSPSPTPTPSPTPIVLPTPSPTFTPLPTPTPSPTPANCAPVPAGISAWRRAENNGNDQMGVSNGTLMSGLAYGNGRVGQAFSGDGLNFGKVNVADSQSLAFGKSLGIEGWIKLNQSGGSHLVISRGPLSASSSTQAKQSWQISTADTFLVFEIANSRSGNVENISALIPIGQFFHFSATLDDTTGQMRLYVNGVQASQRTTSLRPYADFNPAVYGISVANLPTSGYVFAGFNGLIDELSVYNRALTASEIQAIHTAGTATTGPVGKCVQSSPTVTVGGRVTTPSGLGLRNAVVSIVDSQGVRRTATTSSFGVYSFANVAGGGNYTISVSSKRFRFAARTLAVSDNLGNVDFVGLE